MRGDRSCPEAACCLGVGPPPPELGGWVTVTGAPFAGWFVDVGGAISAPGVRIRCRSPTELPFFHRPLGASCYTHNFEFKLPSGLLNKFVLQTEKPRLPEVKCHTASKQQGWGLNPGISGSKGRTLSEVQTHYDERGF